MNIKLNGVFGLDIDDKYWFILLFLLAAIIIRDKMKYMHENDMAIHEENMKKLDTMNLNLIE